MSATPPKISPANSRCAGIVLTATGLGITTVVFFFNPTTHQFYPVCQFHRLTGLNCPGCGMTRSLYAILHGKFATAFRDNALLVLMLGAWVIRSAWFGWNKFCGRANYEFFPANFLWPLLIVALVFTVLRNLPAFTLLSP
jgi:hypothetical protein